jgi:hypothetical protein
MTESMEQAAHLPPTTAEDADWRSPDYVVVDTALEVTAYSLSIR